MGSNPYMIYEEKMEESNEQEGGNWRNGQKMSRNFKTKEFSRILVA